MNVFSRGREGERERGREGERDSIQPEYVYIYVYTYIYNLNQDMFQFLTFLQASERSDFVSSQCNFSQLVQPLQPLDFLDFVARKIKLLLVCVCVRVCAHIVLADDSGVHACMCACVFICMHLFLDAPRDVRNFRGFR
jgi:hypothetical protein